ESPLYLIHCDIWGPSPEPSLTGDKYFILFLDDYSRFLWIYPLKYKSDSLKYFKLFKTTHENLLSTSIKYFQSDGALELSKGDFKQYLDECGILFRSSCPYTPQQNGRAERRNRQITEMGNAMLFQSNCPKCYWFEAF